MPIPNGAVKDGTGFGLVTVSFEDEGNEEDGSAFSFPDTVPDEIATGGGAFVELSDVSEVFP